MPGRLESFLARFDSDTTGPDRSKSRSFQIIVTLVLCGEYWTQSLRGWSLLGVGDFLALAIVTSACPAVITDRGRRIAFAALVGLQIWYIWANFPHTGNHRYLELFFVGLFAVLDDRRADERRLLLQSLRFAVVVVLFYSGLQKLIHGYWFHGQFLAWSMWRESFDVALAPLFSPAELERLSGLEGVAGDGPYRVAGLHLTLLSNAVWASEMSLALLLLVRRTRVLAWVVAAGLIVAVQIVARELMFGLEFLGAILLFARRDLVSRAVWPVVAGLALLLMMRLGLLPEMIFH